MLRLTSIGLGVVVLLGQPIPVRAAEALERFSGRWTFDESSPCTARRVDVTVADEIVQFLWHDTDRTVREERERIDRVEGDSVFTTSVHDSDLENTSHTFRYDLEADAWFGIDLIDGSQGRHRRCWAP